MELKPQDVFVVLKIVAGGGGRLPYAELGRELGMSGSEAHACVKRAEKCGLLHGANFGGKPNVAAVKEFLFHGLRYVLPAEHGTMTRGVPTAYAAPPLRNLIAAGSEPIPVWPSKDGQHRGMAFSPLYKTAAFAAMRDEKFYEYLALADALRDGRARERKLAEQELERRLGAVA